MGREERQIAEEMVVEAADAVEMILTEGVEKAMSRFNRKVTRRRKKIRSRELVVAVEKARNREDTWKSVSTT